MLRRGETSIMIRSTLHDLALFHQVLASGGKRVLDRAHRAIKDGTHLLAFITENSAITCRHSGEFASRDARVRPIPSASAISVTVAPEASALAMRKRRLSRRSSVVGLDCASSVIGVLAFAHACQSARHVPFMCSISGLPTRSESCLPESGSPSLWSVNLQHGFNPRSVLGGTSDPLWTKVQSIARLYCIPAALRRLPAIK